MRTLRVLTSAAILAAGAPAAADIRYDLNARVGERCSIERVNVSNGAKPTVVVHSACNAQAFRLTFLDLTDGSAIQSVVGNGDDAIVIDSSVALTPRRPGHQTTVVHFAKGVDTSQLERISLEVL